MSSPSDQNNDDKAKAYFGYGNDAAQKGNDVLAAQMYREAQKAKPQPRLSPAPRVRCRKFGNDPAKVGRMVGLKLQGLRVKNWPAKSRQKWAEVLDPCEEVPAQSPCGISSSNT